MSQFSVVNLASAHTDLLHATRLRCLTIVAGAVMAMALSACQAPAQGVPDDSSAYEITGTVTTTDGTPLANVEMFADNTLFYDSNILAYTDANGHYRIELPTSVPGTWNVGGYVRPTYHGVQHDLRLHPLLNQGVVADEGGVRDFEWRLTGSVPEGDFYYGEDVWVYEYDFGVDLWIDDVELTFTPLEPLIDGSTIEPFVRRPEGSVIVDVPLGYYRVTARYVPEGAPPSDLLITVRFDDSLAAHADATFDFSPSYGTIMELEVALP